MQVLIKFGDFGQHTIVVPITTLGIVNGELAVLELNIPLRRPDDVPYLNVNVF